MLNKICTMTAKTRAIPSLHRDPSLRSGLLAKIPETYPVLASGNSHRRILAPRYSDPEYSGPELNARPSILQGRYKALQFLANRKLPYCFLP